MKPEYTVLITAVGMLLTAVATWFTARAQQMRKQAAEPKGAPSKPNGEKTAAAIVKALDEWKEDTPEKVLTVVCDKRHDEEREDYRELVRKIDDLTRIVAELVGEMRATRRKREDTPT